ncbi:MAG TPA: hypothetical protein VFU98_02185 [Microlunatus sp.]|nr:hypothetical protein [Microlunatus sp.]
MHRRRRDLDAALRVGIRVAPRPIEKYRAAVVHHRRAFPHDIGFMGRYDSRLEELSPARRLWSPMTVERALAQLGEAGLLAP